MWHFKNHEVAPQGQHWLLMPAGLLNCSAGVWLGWKLRDRKTHSSAAPPSKVPGMQEVHFDCFQWHPHCCQLLCTHREKSCAKWVTLLPFFNSFLSFCNMFFLCFHSWSAYKADWEAPGTGTGTYSCGAHTNSSDRSCEEDGRSPSLILKSIFTWLGCSD